GRISMSSTEAGLAERLALFHQQRDALKLDRASRIALIEGEIAQIEGRWRAEREAHKAACEYCRTKTGKICFKRFSSSGTSSEREEFGELRLLLGLELADADYAEKARAISVIAKKHKDGFNQYWQNLRHRRLALCDWKCEAPGCNNVATDCHHLHYDTLGLEETADVRRLCRACHDAQHGTFKPTRPQGLYVRYLQDLGDKRRAAGIPAPPETHDDRYWNERRRWND